MSQNKDQLLDSLKLTTVFDEVNLLNYSNVDFEKMKNYYLNKEDFYSSISEEALDGDENADIFIKILQLSYEDAVLEIGETDVDILIQTYYLATKMEEDFNKLNSKLDSRIDSLSRIKEYYKKEIENDRYVLDSLKRKN